MEPTAKGILQRLKKDEKDIYSVAERYYNILSAINDLHLTKREIQLMAFAAVKGNISYANIREEFCERYGSSGATINNLISKLKRTGLLVKNGTKAKVNPLILLDFAKPLTLEIKLTHGG